MYEPSTPPNTHLSHPPPTAYANSAAPGETILAKTAYDSLCSVHSVARPNWKSFVCNKKAFKHLAQSKVKMDPTHAR
jgi:hypothetical protein